MQYQQKRKPNKEAVLKCLQLTYKGLIGIETTKYRYERMAGYYTCIGVAIYEGHVLKVRFFISDEAVRTNNYPKDSCAYKELDGIMYQYHDTYISE